VVQSPRGTTCAEWIDRSLKVLHGQLQPHRDETAILMLKGRGRRRSIRSHRNGIGGFFEAILAMMVITAGVTIVTTALEATAVHLLTRSIHDNLERCAEETLADVLKYAGGEGSVPTVSFDAALAVKDKITTPEGARGCKVVLREAMAGGCDSTIALVGDSNGPIEDCVTAIQPILVIHSQSDHRAALLTVVVW
jgi:hypothetical protein